MAAAKALNPTANLFALLSDDVAEPTAVVSAPKAKKQQAPKKEAAGEPTGPAALTPAEKAKLREQNKAKAAASRPAQQERAPRRDFHIDERAAGPRGTGNRGARRAINAEPHGHQPPSRGRAFDRQSGSLTTRKPPAKKGGAGKGNWGDEVKDSIVDQETAAAVSNWGDGPKPVVEDKPEKADESTETAAEEAAPEPEDNQLSLDEYLKQKEAAQQALLAKMGIAPAKPAESAESAEAAATPSAAPAQTSRKGTKAVDVNEVFRVRLPPVGGDRDERPRGRGGRGGRGGARGGAAPRAEGEKPRAPRAEGARGGRGGARGGRGGERGGRGRPLDTSNNRQFPTLQ